MLFDLIKMYVAKSMTKNIIMQRAVRFRKLILNNLYPPMRAFLSGAKTYYFKFHQGHTYRGAYAPTP